MVPARGRISSVVLSLSLLVLPALFTAELLGQGEAPPDELILPIVAHGIIDDPVHFQSTFSFLNLSNSTLEATLKIYDNSGVNGTGSILCEPVVAPDPDMPVPLSPSGSFHQTGATDRPLLNGWGKVSWEAAARIEGSVEISIIEEDPIPCLVICNRPSDEIRTTTQIPAVKAAREFRGQAILTPNRQSAFAVVNPSPTEPAQVHLELLDSSGEVYTTPEGILARATYELAPLHRISGFVWELLFEPCKFGLLCLAVQIPPPPQPQMFHGSLRITSDIPMAAGGVFILPPEGRFLHIPMSRVESD